MSGAQLRGAARVWSWMWRYRSLWTVAGALCFGWLAALGARHYIHERLDAERQRLMPTQETIDLIVASRALQAGELISADAMARRAVEARFAPASALSPEQFESVLGARLLVAMKAGEPLVSTALETLDERSMASRVKPGIRAMTIAVDEVNSLSGLLQPGDRIDLLWSVRAPVVGSDSTGEVTQVVMQGVMVLATGQRLNTSRPEHLSNDRAYTTITVEVNPEQAQKLILAQRHGALTAVLRNPEDHSPVEVPQLDLKSLLGIERRMVNQTEAPSFEVIVGGQGGEVLRRAANAAPVATTPIEPPVSQAHAPRGPADELESVLKRALNINQP